MLNGPFPPWPSYTPEEAGAVQRVLLSNKVNYWTGDVCRAFELSLIHTDAADEKRGVDSGGPRFIKKKKQ